MIGMISLLSLDLVLLLAASAGAHVGDRVYPIHELTDEMLAGIQLDDGSTEEWYDLVGEPSMTPEDFVTRDNREFDPSDLDFRIWLAWHDATDRLYVAFSGSDDVYNDNNGKSWPPFKDSLLLSVDGDHSGTTAYQLGDSPGYIDIEGRELWWESQQYMARASLDGGTPALEGYFSTLYLGGDLWEYSDEVDGSHWMFSPPYGDLGGGVQGEGPTISAIELYITPYDGKLGADSYDDPDEVVPSDLEAGEVIGFAPIVFDWDSDEWEDPWKPGAIQASLQEILFLYRADVYLDGLLLPAGPVDSPETAIESIAWGRIKAALE